MPIGEVERAAAVAAFATRCAAAATVTAAQELHMLSLEPCFNSAGWRKDHWQGPTSREAYLQLQQAWC